MSETKKAQFTLRDHEQTAHVQVGETNSYSTFDLPATDAMREYYHESKKAGKTHDSFAASSTQYAPVKVLEEVRTVRTLIGYQYEEVLLD